MKPQMLGSQHPSGLLFVQGNQPQRRNGRCHLMCQVSSIANAALKERRVGCHEVCVSGSYRIESFL